MWRAFRPTSALRGVSRNIAHDDTVLVQKVRFVKNTRSRLTKFATGIIVTCICVKIYTQVVINPMVKDLRSLIEEAGLDLDDDDDEDDDRPLFVPLPLTTTVVNPPPYAITDPEWQEFVLLAKDEEHQEQLKVALLDFVVGLARRSFLQKRFGGPIEPCRDFLDIHYPYYPPPYYERKGLLLDDQGLALAAQKVDSLSNARNSYYTYALPTALLQGTISFARTKADEHLRAALKLLGIEKTESEPSQAANNGASQLPMTSMADMQKALQRMRAKSTRRPEEVGDPNVAAPKQREAAVAGSAATAKAAAPQTQTQTQTAAPPPNGTTGRRGKEDTGQNEMANANSWKAFSKTVRHELTTRSPPHYHPRGCVAVSGIVCLDAKTAQINLDVIAYYDPTKREYDTRSMKVHVRNIKYKNQRPLTRA